MCAVPITDPAMHETRDGGAEQRAVRQHREKQRYAHRKHEHLRAQPGTAPIGNEDAPRGRETERGVIKGQAEQGADDEQRGKAGADGLCEIPGAQHDKKKRHAERCRVEGDAAAAEGRSS
jgi:hypothetical protein